MVNSVSFSVKPVLPPGVSTTTTIHSTSGLSPQQHQQQQQQHYLQQCQQQHQQQQQQQQEQYRYSSSQQEQYQQQQQQHTLYSPQPKLPLSSPRQEHPTHNNNRLQGSRPQSPAPQPPLHHSSQNSQQQQQQHNTQQHHAQHPAQEHPSSHRPHSPSQQQHPSTTMHTSDNNIANNSHGQGFDSQLRLKPYTLGPSSHTDHWPQHHQHHNHHKQQQHRPSHDSGEPYPNNNQPSGSSDGHLKHSRNDLPADKNNSNNSNNNMIHLPVKKEPDSEQGHNRLNMVQKGNKRHLEYRDRNNVESLDEDRVDQHMEDPDSEQYQQHQRHHEQPSSSSSSTGYYPQDHHQQQQHRGPPSGGDPARYHSSGSYQDSMYHHQQQPQPNQQQHHPGGRPHSLSARSLPSLLPRPMDASDGRPGESSRGHPRDEQASYGWDEMRHRPQLPPGGRPTIHTDMESPHFGSHRNNQPPMSAGPHSASIHSPSQSTAPASTPVSAAAAPTTPATISAPAAAATSSSSSSVSTPSSAAASSSAVLVPAPPGSVVVNNGSSKKRTTPAKHKCPECDKYFTRPFNLKSHQRTHTQERPFVCSFAHCARAFSRLHDCNRHMRTHWRIKPYSCPECHRNFVRQDALTRHLRLDFGHNRCSGYPGPLPGNADQGEKDGDEDEEDMMEDDEDFPDPDAEDQNTGNDSKPTSKSATNTTGSATTAAGVKGDPSPALPSPTSPTAVSNKAKAASTPGASDQERERSLTISTAAANANASAVYTVAASSASATKETHPTLRTSDLTQSKFDKEDQERSPHARHSSSATPMSFVHLADRPVATPEGGKEVSGQPHSRSYSHSAYNYGPTTPLTIQTGNMPMRPTKHLERRATAPVAREGESWLGHAQGQGYAQEPVSSPVDEYPRGGPGYGGYRHDMDRPRSATHLPPDYPTSPKDIRRSPGPQSAQGEWHTRSGPPSAHWGWSNPPPSSQDARLRHPTWSSSSSLPSHSQDPSSMQPPHSPAESWSRGHPPSSPHDDPRKSSIRAMSRYGSSPYPIPDHGSGGAERHHRGSSGPMSPAGPMRSSDPYRRSTATAEMDRVGSWNEQRSRSFHGAEGMQDPRSRYESAGSNLPPASSAMSAGRSPIAADATSSSLVSERSHSVSGMVGVERLYPATSIGGGSFHEREHPSGSIPSPIKSSMAAGDLNGRDYRPTRSQSMMDYDADRMAAAAMRRSRYAGDPKVMLREERRSMSPPGHRLPIIDTSRSYEGGGPRYPYSAGAERPPSGPGPAMEGGSYSSREEMDEMQTRRRDEGGVPNSGGYYDEHGPRSATFQRAPHGY